MCRISWFYKNQIIEIYKLYSSLRSQVSSNLQYFYDDDKKADLNFNWPMRIQGKIHCKIVSMWDFFKNQIKLVKVVGVNLDKLTCATLPAAAPICKQPKVWLKQVPIVALLGPIFQLSWFWLEDILLSYVFHTWYICDLMFANPLPTVEEVWRPRKAADDKGILKRGHNSGNAAPQLKIFSPKESCLIICLVISHQ